MDVTIDPDRCQGHARCWEICPTVFELDDEGHGTVRTPTVPADVADQVRSAAANCPERAILLRD